MQILDYKDYISRTGYGVKQKCDIELFVAHIEKTTVQGKKNRAAVYAYYNEEHLDSNEWCSVMYILKNAGKTDISTLNIFWHYQQSSCIFPAAGARRWAEGNFLNYEFCYDKKIRTEETVSLKICYHKDAIVPGIFSAPMSIGMIDDNGRHWIQPFFVPQDKIYDSRIISPKEYIEKMRTEAAEECFRKPWLW